jgi:acyl carrier protein
VPDILQEIHDHVLAEFPTERAHLAPDENLLAQGILDSMGLLNLVTHLETRYGIAATEADMVPENFATLRAIVAFVERKRGVAS